MATRQLAYKRNIDKTAPYDGADIAGDKLKENCDLEELRSVLEEIDAAPVMFAQRLKMRLHTVIEREEEMLVMSGLCPICQDVKLERDYCWRGDYYGPMYCKHCGWEE